MTEFDIGSWRGITSGRPSIKLPSSDSSDILGDRGLVDLPRAGEALRADDEAILAGGEGQNEWQSCSPTLVLFSRSYRIFDRVWSGQARVRKRAASRRRSRGEESRVQMQLYPKLVWCCRQAQTSSAKHLRHPPLAFLFRSRCSGWLQTT